MNLKFYKTKGGISNFLNLYILLYILYSMLNHKCEIPVPTQSLDMDCQGGSSSDTQYERYWKIKE